MAGPLFEDTLRAWSGDHCIDPRLIPGVIFSSHKMVHDEPDLVGIAPTALRLFGIEPPTRMDGKYPFDEASVRTSAPDQLRLTD